MLTNVSANSEAVMLGDDFSKVLSDTIDVFPVIEDSDDDDDDELSAQSCDIQFDLDIGLRHHRSNNLMRMESKDSAKKKAIKTKIIKWESNNTPLSEEFLTEMFSKKELKPREKLPPVKSLLSVQLEKYVQLPKNPYMEYGKFDGNAQVGIPVRKYKIFLTMLPEEQRNYPMVTACIATAKISDLIGLICLKCR